ncbi:MAG: anthranilate synthase component I [Coriobacteriaceae bacterium]|nr:anthranilate synthase component I [Coriobacteriaceae bacterium]
MTQPVTTPSLEEALAYTADGSYKRVPIAREILSDTVTPITVMRKLKNVSDHCYLLESAADSAQWGRYSFLGYDPTLEVTCLNGQMKVGALSFEVDHPARYLRQILQEYRTPKVPGMPSFTGGLVGYFSYDYLKYAEPSLVLDAHDSEGFKDVDLMLFDKVIAFDNFKQKIILVVNADLSEGEAGYRRAVMQLGQMADLVLNGDEAPEQPGHLKSEVHPLFDEERYCAMVRQAQYHIHEGDIFQVVLSNRLEAEFEGSLLNAYRVLRTLNPSPYMFYFASSDMEVAGASPETLVKLEDGVLHTFPLAGTRPRGATPAQDAALEAELLADEKELAEHNMLVDLGRNDLGKIARFGSVEVEKYQSIERFSHVMHIGSTVRGLIDDAHDAVDAVDAILPAGTLSGAPKIRACQIINDLENNKRGIYGGAIGYLDFTGNLDTCIAIRLAFKKNGKVFIRSGAGIVADSVPEKEYRECINKAAAVVAALHEAEELQ